ncbi:MAG: hypothetical protein KF889_09000 [Alphaproteobacteria bacterium]|nr:hypothetical protein [Alphaproteobacteria bacterium]MCW5740960.1 hypothetical protein [Alphaproteobacteria bacterium]
MTTLEELLRLHGTLTPARIERWIAVGLLRPEGDDDPPRFAAIDVARVQLLIELREDLAIDDSALEAVVPLLDQVHTLRHRLARLADAIARQPEEVRRAIAAALVER